MLWYLIRFCSLMQRNLISSAQTDKQKNTNIYLGFEYKAFLRQQTILIKNWLKFCDTLSEEKLKNKIRKKNLVFASYLSNNNFICRPFLPIGAHPQGIDYSDRKNWFSVNRNQIHIQFADY